MKKSAQCPDIHLRTRFNHFRASSGIQAHRTHLVVSAIWYARPTLRLLVRCLFTGVWGCALLAYLPIRAGTDPWRNWGDPSSIDALWDHFWASRIRAAYADQMGQFKIDTLVEFLEQVGGPGCILAALGLTGLTLSVRYPVSRVLLSILVADMLYSVFINPMGVRDAQNGIVTVGVLLAGSAITFNSILCKLNNHWILSAGVGICLALSTPQAYSDDRGLPALLDAAAAAAPIDAILMVSSDNLAAGLAYRQVVEGARPDLAVIVRQHVAYKSSVGPVKRRRPFALPRWQPGHQLAEISHLQGRWPILWEWSAGLDSAVRPRSLQPQFPLFSRGVGTKAQMFDGPLKRLDAMVGRQNFIAVRSLASLRTDWAQFLLTQNKVEQATEQLLKTTQLEPENPKRWNNLGAAFSRLGNLDHAISATEHALILQPTDPITRTNLARYRLAKGEIKAAEELLIAVVSDRPTASAWALLGTIAGNRGDLDMARRYFIKALILDPTQSDAKAGLVQLDGAPTP